MYRTVLFLSTALLIFSSQLLMAQLVAGPMLGHVELRTAKIWAEVVPGSSADVWYWKKGQPEKVKSVSQTSLKSAWYAPLIFNLVDLEMNTTYDYAVTVNNKAGKKPVKADGSFTTSDLWQWRKPAPDFSFLTGSCAYFNEPKYDRPGVPYGKDSSIFEAMAKEKAACMIWLGDNWYYREADYFSEWGLWNRAHHDRSLPILQPFLKAMPHYAIWDDHDYGPNDAEAGYPFKETARTIFSSYWANPTYGFKNEGINTRLSVNDCDFFMMDDRTYRSSDDMQPMINGAPNPSKRMWGAAQLEWLKNSLLVSKAPFKFIVTGSQTLNPASPFDCLQDYPIEFRELMQFLSDEKINGVLFLTGDRHHSEIIKYDREASYSLYDITSSPLTSGVGFAGGQEKNNPAREPNTLVEAQNYTRISVSGKPKERRLKVEFLGIKGEKLAEWSISENELKNK